MRFDLLFAMRDIYINFTLDPLTKFTSSSRNTVFKDILPWDTSQIITKTVPISIKNSHKLYDETGHAVFSLTES